MIPIIHITKQIIDVIRYDLCLPENLREQAVVSVEILCRKTTRVAIPLLYEAVVAVYSVDIVKSAAVLFNAMHLAFPSKHIVSFCAIREDKRRFDRGDDESGEK